MSQFVPKHSDFSLTTLLSVMGLVGNPTAGLSAEEACDALSSGQIVSKIWLIEEFDRIKNEYVPDKLKVIVLGGWLGLLPNMLMSYSTRASAVHVLHCLDIDPRCAHLAEEVNRVYLHKGIFRAITADMLEFDVKNYDVIINTSCEHLEDVRKWFSSLPKGRLTILQSNNMFNHAQHKSCVKNLVEFQNQCVFSHTLFAGELPLYRFTRYMLIGVT